MRLIHQSPSTSTLHLFAVRDIENPSTFPCSVYPRSVSVLSSPMLSIVPFLDEDARFDQRDVAAMSRALSDVIAALKLGDHKSALEIVAIRIIELAQEGERSSTGLRDRLLAEAQGGTRC